MNNPTQKPLAIVSGALANKPRNGGNAWSRLSWVAGLRKLGFEVLFVEEIHEAACVDATGRPCRFDDSVNLAFFRATMAEFGLEQKATLICEPGGESWGAPLAVLGGLAPEAACLLNISGHLTHPDIKDAVRCKVYYDDDPGFTQFWHAQGNAGPRLEKHDFYFTIGENIGSPDCLIPAGQIPWRHTRPPVVLDDWPVCAQRTRDRFTTIASWRGAYGPVEYAGKKFGLKAHEFRKFIDLPRRGAHEFEIALQIHPADQKDRDALIAHGWRLTDPSIAAGSVNRFRDYVRNSAAEFSVAQGIYVETHSGWFSDRTIRYLASGRPALVQDTGFSRNLPVDEGLLAFRTLEEAGEGAEGIFRDYPRHCQAARRVAEAYFDSDKVIGKLLTEAGLK